MGIERYGGKRPIALVLFPDSASLRADGVARAPAQDKFVALRWPLKIVVFRCAFADRCCFPASPLLDGVNASPRSSDQNFSLHGRRSISCVHALRG